MPDPKALTPEQINLLRGLPGQLSELKKSPDAERLYLAGLLTRTGSPEYSTVVRTTSGDLLLATIDSERERVRPLAEAAIRFQIAVIDVMTASDFSDVESESSWLDIQLRNLGYDAANPNPQGETDQ